MGLERRRLRSQLAGSVRSRMNQHLLITRLHSPADVRKSAESPLVPPDRSAGTVVDTGGFKASPDGAGMVEVVNHILSRHEGRGYATEAATALV